MPDFSQEVWLLIGVSGAVCITELYLASWWAAARIARKRLPGWRVALWAQDWFERLATYFIGAWFGAMLVAAVIVLGPLLTLISSEFRKCLVSRVCSRASLA